MPAGTFPHVATSIHMEQRRLKADSEQAILFKLTLQSNLNGSNIFGTMEMRSRNG